MNFSQIESSMVRGAQAQIDHADEVAATRDQIESQCHQKIKDLALNALKGTGIAMSERVIPTHKASVCWSALTLVQDQLGGTQGDGLLVEMLTIIRGIARSESPALSAYANDANKLLGKFAEAHADYWASDLADEVMGESA